MKDIPGFPHYKITEDGKVWSKHRKRFLKPTPISKHNKYERFGLSENGKETRIGTHRLLALVFIPNPENLPSVDHIDRDKSNNSLSNLRWVSESENMINRTIHKNKFGFRHINFIKRRNITYFKLQIHRNKKLIFQKCFSTSNYTLNDIVKYRNEIVYPQFNIAIDD